MEGEVGRRTPSARNIPYFFRAATTAIVIWRGSCTSVEWDEHERGEVRQRGERERERRDERRERRGEE